MFCINFFYDYLAISNDILSPFFSFDKIFISDSIIFPNTFTGDAAFGLFDSDIGVLPKKIQIAFPGGQNANSPISTSL